MSSGTSSSSESSEILDLEDDEGWEDTELDEEKSKAISLFGEDAFDDVRSMLQHCKDNHQFDLVKVRNEFDLDFLEVVKLVNYVRSEVQRGNTAPDVSVKSSFLDDRYLQPVLQDDALLYNLDDLFDDLDHKGDSTTTALAMEPSSDAARIIELEIELQSLKLQFENYRKDVSETLEKRWDSNDNSSNMESKPSSRAAPLRDDDSHYFNSYSYNDIHETMLKDAVRTDAYRDFIYDNKDLFKDKVILDVGCGTGILSLFCARAGAAKVIAVDNSDIINKARENVFENGLGDVVSCLRGKIEEVILPVTQVDIIVSEWMGYCLLYEAMLDSVLWARDRYLAPNGLMAPSNVTLHLAPLSDPEYIADHISFWQSVYGFNMSSMRANIYDEVLVRDLKSSRLPADPFPFLHLQLHSTKLEDLTFTHTPFTMELKEDIDELDGFVIWFDTFFLTSKDESVPSDAKAENWGGHEQKGIGFTTGPGGPETHWRQGVLLIDHSKRQAEALKKGQHVGGEIGYRKREDNSRELEIEIKWEVAGSEEKGKQLWFMR